ncbi:Fe-S oxidoreductase [Bradyrhizobium oligotrophicum S58]|uniref:Fe-S oxidoreductase n=1 Tax=Bradyrhizobium oligotrophicum S58 TaxID=1245469 RepID=M4ZYG9_9BRAD|nr:radical SAM protein [Bradyrhizobium oligotrophicum]BAM91495.1 Fe-S oxidoreductase [Bradyrhizobium oligotrophicum S58]
MKDWDFILICQSNVVEYDAFSALPIDRLDLFRSLVYPRMVRHEGKFVGHLDFINSISGRPNYFEADYPGRRQSLNIWNLPSASGLHVANYLLSFGIRTKIINNIDSDWDLFEEAYRSCGGDIPVGISSTFFLSFKEIGRICKRLKKLDPDMEIIVGGAFANSYIINGSPADLAEPMRKYGIKHMLHAFNSEFDLRDLLVARRKGEGFDQVKNLCSYQGGSFTAGPVQWNTPLLDDCPALWDQLDAPFLNRTVQIRTASGCPFSCAFCSYPTTAGGWKTLGGDKVRMHLDAVKRIGGIDRIIFIDDTFNVPPHRYKALLKIFQEYDFEWFSFLRVQYVDEDIVRAMKDSGCKGVYLGVESANDTVLENMNKKARRADFQRGIELLNKYDINSLAAFVLGFPGETDKTIQDNMDFIENCGVQFYSLKEFYYMEHTDIHNRREEFGLTGMGANWKHNTMSHEDAGRIKLEMFQSIKNACFVDPDTSLWYMAYLYDQGYDFREIRQLQEGINTIMKRQLAGDFGDNDDVVASLKALHANRLPGSVLQASRPELVTSAFGA